MLRFKEFIEEGKLIDKIKNLFGLEVKVIDMEGIEENVFFALPKKIRKN